MADDTIAKIGIDVDVTGAKEAGDQLDNLGKKGKKAEGGLKDVAKGANKTNGPFRAMRGSVQQVSWQLQDVAVQAQMGTSMFTILGQQGPQLASIFGPGGAVVGAFIAFGAMAAGVLYTTLSGASKLTKELTKETENLYEKTDELNGALKELAMLQAAKRQEELKKAITEATAAMEVSKTVIASVALGAVVWDETLKKANETVITQNGIIAVSNKALGELAQQNDGVSAATEKLSEKLREELLELQLTEEQFLRYKAAQGGATAAQIEGIVAAQALIDAEKEKAKALEDAAKALEKSKEELASYSEGLYHQLEALHLSGDALYYYQAALKGGTAEQIAANAELLKSIALRKEKIKADADAVKAQAKADADAVKARRKAEADALNQGDSARSLLEEIALENMTELEQLEAHLIKKGGLLFQYLEEGHITLDQYLLMDAELQATYRTAEEEAIAESNQKKLDSAKAYADAKASLDQQVLSSASALVGQLADAAEEGSSAQKALFAIQKAIAIATTIVNTEMAAIAAVAPPPIGLGPVLGAPYSFAIRAMGYASAGIIAGTAIAGGRALGGQVRGGESYLVGERGPELLTMGTSGRIASNDSLKNAVGGNSGADVVVNQTINVTTGIQSTVRAEIIQLMPQIAQAAKGAVADGRLRGGNFSKVMSGA
jgi:hypothetical protein